MNYTVYLPGHTSGYRFYAPSLHMAFAIRSFFEQEHGRPLWLKAG